MAEEAYDVNEETSIFDSVYLRIERVLESHTSANLLIMAVILLASLPLLGIGFFTTRTIAPVEAARMPVSATVASGMTAVFNCLGRGFINAIFSRRGVELTLSDGRQISLPPLGSENGTYANPDQSFVFSNVGNSASIIENGVNTYDSCSTSG